MSFDREEREYHLTPNGWVTGAPPADRVKSVMWRRVEQSWDDVEGEESEYTSFGPTDQALADALEKKFGPPRPRR